MEKPDDHRSRQRQKNLHREITGLKTLDKGLERSFGKIELRHCLFFVEKLKTSR